ncbi:hypothetical protein PAPYR_8163 [Paratrimastix pyriformis]|uniref:PH domain-containing protein n=1 Tax=Paratrimastix pyriformis TaxID=342808 RepID=A0ABQ8UBC8_9EUKA|nr:hypothetical protein PAPYR_8163 [Paratrimastix pyriformis]
MSFFALRSLHQPSVSSSSDADPTMISDEILSVLQSHYFEDSRPLCVEKLNAYVNDPAETEVLVQRIFDWIQHSRELPPEGADDEHGAGEEEVVGQQEGWGTLSPLPQAPGSPNPAPSPVASVQATPSDSGMSLLPPPPEGTPSTPSVPAPTPTISTPGTPGGSAPVLPTSTPPPPQPLQQLHPQPSQPHPQQQQQLRPFGGPNRGGVLAQAQAVARRGVLRRGGFGGVGPRPLLIPAPPILPPQGMPTMMSVPVPPGLIRVGMGGMPNSSAVATATATATAAAPSLKFSSLIEQVNRQKANINIPPSASALPPPHPPGGPMPAGGGGAAPGPLPAQLLSLLAANLGGFSNLPALLAQAQATATATHHPNPPVNTTNNPAVPPPTSSATPLAAAMAAAAAAAARSGMTTGPMATLPPPPGLAALTPPGMSAITAASSVLVRGVPAEWKANPRMCAQLWFSQFGPIAELQLWFSQFGPIAELQVRWAVFGVWLHACSLVCFVFVRLPPHDNNLIVRFDGPPSAQLALARGPPFPGMSIEPLLLLPLPAPPTTTLPHMGTTTTTTTGTTGTTPQQQQQQPGPITQQPPSLAALLSGPLGALTMPMLPPALDPSAAATALSSDPSHILQQLVAMRGIAGLGLPAAAMNNPAFLAAMLSLSGLSLPPQPLATSTSAAAPTTTTTSTPTTAPTTTTTSTPSAPPAPATSGPPAAAPAGAATKIAAQAKSLAQRRQEVAEMLAGKRGPLSEATKHQLTSLLATLDATLARTATAAATAPRPLRYPPSSSSRAHTPPRGPATGPQQPTTPASSGPARVPPSPTSLDLRPRYARVATGVLESRLVQCGWARLMPLAAAGRWKEILGMPPGGLERHGALVEFWRSDEGLEALRALAKPSVLTGAPLPVPSTEDPNDYVIIQFATRSDADKTTWLSALPTAPLRPLPPPSALAAATTTTPNLNPTTPTSPGTMRPVAGGRATPGSPSTTLVPAPMMGVASTTPGELPGLGGLPGLDLGSSTTTTTHPATTTTTTSSSAATATNTDTPSASSSSSTDGALAAPAEPAVAAVTGSEAGSEEVYGQALVPVRAGPIELTEEEEVPPEEDGIEPRVDDAAGAL